MRPDIFVAISCHELHDIFSSAVVYFSAFARHIRKVEIIFGMKIHHPGGPPNFCSSKRLYFMKSREIFSLIYSD